MLRYVWYLALFGYIAALIVVPLLIIRMRADYFTEARWPTSFRHPVLRIAILILKNLVGFVFLVAGIAMLPLPGPGLLTLFIAATLLDFPRKREVERWLITTRPVSRVAQWLRRKAGKPPLQLP